MRKCNVFLKAKSKQTTNVCSSKIATYNRKVKKFTFLRGKVERQHSLLLFCLARPIYWVFGIFQSRPVLLNSLSLVTQTGVSGNSCSRSFPRMKTLSRTLGIDFFIPFPFPNIGNEFFPFPSRSRILGMGFFHSLPIPEIWEWIFLFPSRSRISGMGFFNSLPVPKFSKVIPAHPCLLVFIIWKTLKVHRCTGNHDMYALV